MRVRTNTIYTTKMLEFQRIERETRMTRTLFIPGIDGSPATHW